MGPYFSDAHTWRTALRMSQASHYVPLAWGSRDAESREGRHSWNLKVICLSTSWPLSLQSPQLAPSFASLNRLLLQQSSNNDVLRNTWQLLTWANGKTQFPHFQAAPWMGTGVAETLRNLTWQYTSANNNSHKRDRDFKLLRSWPLLPLKQRGSISCCC